MKTALRVLLVEDSDLDAQSILRKLTAAGYQIESQRVECEVEFREALGKQRWDLIVCDYKLPRFNAPGALVIAMASELDIPFIVVSGAIDPEFVVEIMRQGAQDYLAKGDMARFVPVIERELREATRRSYEGTGLGLYLCRKLLILMGGNITAHSVYGHGTRISFDIPRRLKTQAA
jgi:DNA-binding NtrC family response regulator